MRAGPAARLGLVGKADVGVGAYLHPAKTENDAIGGVSCNIVEELRDGLVDVLRRRCLLLLGANGARYWEEFVVHSSTIVEQHPHDVLDARDTSIIKGGDWSSSGASCCLAPYTISL